MGAGESGIGAALLAKKLGMRPFVSDQSEIREIYKQELVQHSIEYEEGGHSADRFLNADTIVKSPGIPSNAQVLKASAEKNIPVIGEIEFAYRFYDGKIIGITGTNGKTTTTILTGYLLEQGGINTKTGGNTGVSFSRLLLNNPPDVAVLELSSFQIEDIDTFCPDCAAFINFSPDHLERYHKSEKYFDAKWKLAEAQNTEGHFVYNYDDTIIRDKVQSTHLKQETIPFSLNKTLNTGAYISGNTMTVTTTNQNPFFMNIEELSLKGGHNLQNTMAATIMARLFEVRKNTIRESLKTFTGLEHRLENVLTIKGVTYINDSKATNVNAVWYALESMNRPVVWIAGGIDKGNDYSLLKPLVQEKVKALITVGKDNSRLSNAFSDTLDKIEETDSMQAAVNAAYSVAETGDVVLLSPACSSFDLFDNYIDRGHQFKDNVKAL